MYSYRFHPGKSRSSANNDAANGRRSRHGIPVIAGAAIAATLALALPPASAVAATATTTTTTTTTATFNVTATVVAACTITAGALAFGNYVGAQMDGTATVTVTCTNTTPYNVGLNAGSVTGATVATRKMTGPAGALLSYALFRDTGRATNGGTTIGTDTIAGTGNGAAQPLTIYGRVAAARYPAPGAYTDTITATITATITY
jgi:spore coat protein U-like protein